jgi:hypothetical protein
MKLRNAITCQLTQIGEHIASGSEGYSLGALQEFRDAILDAHDIVAAQIMKSEKAAGALRQLLGVELPKGGAA